MTTTRIIDENFNLSDESDSESNYNDDDINFLNRYDLKYYPQPYNNLGQLIMSAIVGTLTSFILNKRENKDFDLEKSLNKYFDYCKKVENDKYVNELVNELELDRDDLEDKVKLLLILDKTRNLTIQLVNELLFNNNSYSSYIKKLEDEFNIEQLGIDLLKDIINILKFDRLKNLV
jgi:hypothetical protein